MVLVCCGGLFFLAESRSGDSSGGSDGRYDLEKVPLPNFPPYQTAMKKRFGNVMLHSIPLGTSRNGHYSTPGHGGSLFYYLPPGEHAPGSLPCVLITAAGSNLFQGKNFDRITTVEDAAEHLPYVHAGMAVMVYEMDGSQEFKTDSEFKTVHKDFKAACAGMVNARNAFEYVLQKCPEVNPDQIFAAGHSSAGTAALLFAAHEPRLAGCVAYAPVTDIAKFLPPDSFFKLLRRMPSLTFYMSKASPATHAKHIECPVYLFASYGDKVVDRDQVEGFTNILRNTNSNVELDMVGFGDHYQSMIDDGVPSGISWINMQIGKTEQRIKPEQRRSKRILENHSKSPRAPNR